MNNQETSLEEMLQFIEDESTQTLVDPNENLNDPDDDLDLPNPDNSTEDPIEDPLSSPSIEDPEDPSTIEDPIEDPNAAPIEEPNNDPVDATDDSGLKSYFELLAEEGIITPEEDFEFDGTTDSFAKAIEQTKAVRDKQAVQQIWESLPEDFKPLLAYGLNGGTDIQKYLDTFKSKTLEELDIENPTDQKQILKQYYKETTPHDDEKIDKFISRLEKIDSLEEEAETALQELREIEKEKRIRLAQQEKEALRLKEEEEIAARQEIISLMEEDSELDSRKKKSLQAFFFNPIKKGETTDTDLNRSLKTIGQNKKHWVQLGKFIFENYDPKEGFTFKSIKKSADTKATKDLKSRLDDVLSGAKTKVSGTTSKINKTNDQLNKWEWLV